MGLGGQGLVLVALTSGCTAVLTYPPPATETCNGLDDDFDGVVDDGVVCVVAPDLTPCPDDLRCAAWTDRWWWSAADGGTPVPSPWPGDVDRECDAGEVAFPDGAGCRPLGRPCAPDGWPSLEAIAETERIWVDRGATGPADGSQATPWPAIGAGLADASARLAADGGLANRVVVLVRAGMYDESLIVPEYVRVVGGCPEDTVIAASGAGPAVTLRRHAKLENVTIVAARETAVSLAGQSAELVQVRVLGAGDPAVRLDTETEGRYPIHLRDVVVSDTAGVAVELSDHDGRVDATNLRIDRAESHGVRVEGRARLDATGLAATDVAGSALYVERGGAATVRGLVVARPAMPAIWIETGSTALLSDVQVVLDRELVALYASTGARVTAARFLVRGGIAGIVASRATVTADDVRFVLDRGIGILAEDLGSVRVERAEILGVDWGTVAHDDVGSAPEVIVGQDLHIEAVRTGIVAYGGDVTLARSEVLGARLGVFVRYARAELRGIRVVSGPPASGVEPWADVATGLVAQGGFGVIVQSSGELDASTLIVEGEALCAVLVHQHAIWDGISIVGGTLAGATACGCWQVPYPEAVGRDRSDSAGLLGSVSCRAPVLWSPVPIDNASSYP